MSDRERSLPHSLEAERAVLGAILTNNAAFAQVSSGLSPADFFRQAHAKIYAAIEALLEWSGGAADLVMVQEYLRRGSELEDVGGPSYLAQLVDGVPRSVNATHYARIVREHGQRRRLIGALTKGLAESYAGEMTVPELFASVDRAVVAVQANSGSGETLLLRDGTPALLAELDRRHDAPGEVIGLDTGYPSINNETLGWQRGDLIVIGARPSIGKTTFVMNTAQAAAARGYKVGVFSLEMRRRQLEMRMVSSLSGVPLSRVLSGRLMEPDFPQLVEATRTMNALPIWINDGTGLTVWDIRSECRRLKAEEGLDLVVIDYVQLVAGSLERRGASRNEEVTDISRRLKTLAGELEVPVLLLSQLSRAGEKRDDPYPKLSDLRESGALEQDADVVLFLHRKNHREGGLTFLILAKQRNGPTGVVRLTLDRDIVTFIDGYSGPEPASDTKSAKVKAPKQVTVG